VRVEREERAMSTEVDVAVIGLGPGGEFLASELATAGLEVVGIDRRLVGGECPYFGCVPTKMMIRGADLLAEGRRIPQLAGASSVTPDWRPVATRISDEATDDWNDQVAVDRLEKAGVTFVRGHARLAGPGRVEVDGQLFETRRGVVLNTGTEPGVPPIPGLAGTPYWTNREAVRVEELPGSLIVIGGGSVGVELAQVFSRFGVEVTLLEAAGRILALEEPESSEVLARTFDAEGIKVVTDASISSVAYADDRFTVTVGGSQLQGDRLLVAAGRRTNLGDLGLETVSVDPASKTLATDEQMQVAPGLWAIGDITGKGGFTHISMYQAGIAIPAILGANDAPAADYRAVPRVTFTDPEVGSVGMTEQQARDAGLSVRVGVTDLAKSSRGWIHKAGNAGLIKLVEDADRGVLVGASSVGPTGGEVLSALSVAVHGEVPTKRLGSMIYAYPTFHRAIEVALKELAGDRG
jgi:pyruvate/2-oxoglutarate dehydrogenase complex dihydrolipoamide dehydrogenase (E3) component